MLTPPNKGFASYVSVDVHNVQLDAMAEWLEGCITFIDKVVSMSDVKDILLQESHYRNQDFAQERIDDAWAELAWRNKCLGPVATFTIEPKRLIRRRKWQDSPAYSFCLMLALQVAYRKTFAMFRNEGYVVQGELFERLTAEALGALGWLTHSTGWSHAASDSVADKVEAVGKHLGEPHRPEAVGLWTEARAKDVGLDVICHLPFQDGWAGRPLFFVQCASGENWKDKRHTPDIQQWMKLLDLATEPRRGISHPFVELNEDFRRSANCEQLMLVLDRHRLSRPGGVKKAKWTSNDLSKEMNSWTKSRLPALKKNDAD
jgi:hypothetical protein